MALVSDVTADLVGRMLDVQKLRAEAAAGNIARANVPGYIPQEVDFRSQVASLQQDLQQPEALAADLAEMRVDGSMLKPEATSSLLGASVNLDNEVSTLTIADTQYETLIESLNRHFGLMTLAITGRE